MPETNEISSHDPYPRLRVDVGGVEIVYVDTNVEGNAAVVFLHGNPTSSYLWRNIIPHMASRARCLAPDLMGMGESDGTPDGSYRFADHSKYLDAWFDAVLPEGPVTLVVHDWGSALGFHWARRHPDRIRGLVYMEGNRSPRYMGRVAGCGASGVPGVPLGCWREHGARTQHLRGAGVARQHDSRDQRRGDGGISPDGTPNRASPAALRCRGRGRSRSRANQPTSWP